MPRPGTLAAAVLALAATGGPAAAGPLENLERERAALLAVLLDPVLDAGQRRQREETALRRLVDLERMVLRDPQAAAAGGALAGRAFADYDLTFLAHASVERELIPLELWLGRLGLSADRLLAARAGRR